MLLIDPPAWPAHGRLWSHLVSTTSYAELHEFAERAGLPRRAFEGDHYDVPEERHAELVAAGAVSVDGRELLKRLRDSGLRIPKRKHERVVTSTPEAPWLPPGSRADVIASRQDDAPPNTVVVRALVRDARGVLVVERADGGGPDLPTRRVQSGERADEAVAALAADFGLNPHRAHLVGYVRNVVREPDVDYGWPTPHACFAVFGLPGPHDSLAAGTARWLASERHAADLGSRHWWPLLEALEDSAGGAGHAHH
ncbi:DUF4031 domain-containing protein [Knoellia subterranea]|uniref:DUF4031 domain-containing protein n=1 Tax=Knoellia subterranea TaxID=184882 RepID=UPI001FDFCCFB|nr:DUF4031 domain-containing protein [Knoellia subterranea]